MDVKFPSRPSNKTFHFQAGEQTRTRKQFAKVGGKKSFPRRCWGGKFAFNFLFAFIVLGKRLIFVGVRGVLVQQWRGKREFSYFVERDVAGVEGGKSFWFTTRAVTLAWSVPDVACQRRTCWFFLNTSGKI
jgi:hypothetical protein